MLVPALLFHGTVDVVFLMLTERDDVMLAHSKYAALEKNNKAKVVEERNKERHLLADTSSMWELCSPLTSMIIYISKKMTRLQVYLGNNTIIISHSDHTLRSHEHSQPNCHSLKIILSVMSWVQFQH